MIGFAVLVAHVALIPIDGCSINPARSLGSAVAINEWEDHWLFWVGPLLGGALAAVLYDQFFYTGVADADSSVFKNVLKRIRAWQEERRKAQEHRRSSKSGGGGAGEKVEEEEEEEEMEEEEDAGELVVVVPPPGSAVAAQQQQQQQWGGSSLSVQQQVARLQQLGAVAGAGGSGLGAPPGAGTPSPRALPPPPLSLPPQEEVASSPEKPRGSVAAMMEAQGSPFISLVKRGGSPPTVK